MVAAAIASATSSAGAVTLVIDTWTGAAFLANETASAALIDAYEITSPSGALLPAGWLTVADNYDQSGDGSIDSGTDWLAFPSDNESLAEASLTPGTGQLDAGMAVNLGLIWDPAAPADVEFSSAVGVTLTTNPASFRPLFADYNGDLVIDADDYQVFATTLGSTIDLRADGNATGVIDAGDYTLWRDALAGAEVDPPFPLATGSATPEPTAVSVAFLLAAAITPRRRRLPLAAAS